MKKKMILAAACAVLAATVHAQSLTEMASAAPANASALMAADITQLPAGLDLADNANVKYAVSAIADRTALDFSYDDVVWKTPCAADLLDRAAANRYKKVTRTKIDGKDAVVLKGRDEVKTLVALAPDRTLETEVERGAVKYEKSNLYTPYAPVLKNAVLFVISKDGGLRNITETLIYVEREGKSYVVTASYAYRIKAVAQRVINAELAPEPGEPRENAICAKLKPVSVPGLTGDRITLRATVTADELDDILDILDDIGPDADDAEVDDDDDDDDDD